jgi:TPR repeat protein
VKQDWTAAIRHFTKGAEKDDPRAAYHLGMAYIRGTGLETDHARGKGYLRRAASQDHPAAAFELAKLLMTAAESELGTDRDPADRILTDPIIWLRVAAEAEHAEACFLLGQCYDEGKFLEPDAEQARFWYQSAADAGHEKAKQELRRSK